LRAHLLISLVEPAKGMNADAQHDNFGHRRNVLSRKRFRAETKTGPQACWPMRT
jgi:hypothetical protein